MRNNPFDYAGDVLDLYTWFWIRGWFMPYYILGKQDEWKDWVNINLNGWKPSNLCKPN